MAAAQSKRKAGKARPRGRGFQKGQSGNPAGKKPGTLNKATRDAKVFCQALLTDTDYQKNFQAAWKARTLEPQLEVLVWHYAYGKPAQSLDVTLGFDLAKHLAELSSE